MNRLSGLCRLCRQVVFAMAWSGYNRLYAVIEWLWSRRGFLIRCVTRVFAPVSKRVRHFLGWKEDNGSQDEPENQIPAAAAAADYPEKAEEDDLHCAYDSTWETEGGQEITVMRARRPAQSRNYKFSRFEHAARDMQNYRHDYPNQIRLHRWNQNRPSDDMPNLLFYLGTRPSVPDGAFIHDFHHTWKGDYDRLEIVHSYIQWLFPLQEPGMNPEASTLTKEEIEAFRNNITAKENLLKSYQLMLDFYGIMLCDEETGEVNRAPNWRGRFHNLNNHTHNNLRITRILKCLGTLGYPHFQAPLVQFFLMETLVNGHLPNIKDSVLNYFVFAVLDKKQRRNLIKFAYLNYEPKDAFVWCPRKIQRMWSEQSASET
ncbi:opioid growth factor receptor-like [Toxotes jaculatrix]|uniref:opioid growth factor receptor-like n=1 Tax=Toxotes jaculatrix TaxID=941984 RepID=UPI001B3B0B8F|nr:opioid growth factor receptor-like [Toxotes jaculatrix]